jgi:hypothetical protein
MPLGVLSDPDNRYPLLAGCEKSGDLYPSCEWVPIVGVKLGCGRGFFAPLF